MKTLLAVSLALAFISCANAQSNNGTSAAALGPRTGPAYYSPKNSPYRKWTTAQLQQRRLDLYRQIPQRQDRNRRYQQGDKDAELTRAMPGVQHPGAGGSRVTF